MGEDLLWAVKNGDMDQLKVLIEEKVNICLLDRVENYLVGSSS